MKTWWRRFNELMRLPLADQFLLWQTFIVVAAIKVGLRILPFEHFRRIYSAFMLSRKNGSTPEYLIERRVRAIRQVSVPLSAVCLPQALALTCFLRKDNAVELIVGVRKAQAFEAHAWVEKNGTTLIGELPDADFQPLWVWR